MACETLFLRNIAYLDFFFAQMVDGVAVRDGGDPGRKPGLKIKLAKLVVHPHKSVLTQFFAFFLTVNEPAYHVAHKPFMLLDQQPEGGDFHLAAAMPGASASPEISTP